MTKNFCIDNFIKNYKNYRQKDKNIKITGGISDNEAYFIWNLILKEKTTRILEIGVGKGKSTIIIANALKKIGTENDVKLFCIDPNQITEHNGIVIEQLKNYDCDDFTKFYLEKSHIALPKILNENGQNSFDLIFIDGWHTFDATFIDFFYSDILLKKNGFILMHDLFMPSKQKVLNFIKLHKKYQILKGPINSSMFRSLLSFSNQLLKLKISKAFNRILRKNNLLVANKVDNFNAKYDFFKNF